jgi:hypothetical protein
MNILAIFVLSLSASTATPPSQLPQTDPNIPQIAPPPPVRVKEVPRAATPARIAVGDKLQFVYTGPAAYWVGSRVLTEQELAAAERNVRANPDDICARGDIIAFARQSEPNHEFDGLTRLDHVLWMVRNHPEWDGFSLEPFYSLMRR